MCLLIKLCVILCEVIIFLDHPCTLNNGNCSHFCLVTSNGYKCTCPDGMSLIDKNTCFRKYNHFSENCVFGSFIINVLSEITLFISSVPLGVEKFKSKGNFHRSHSVLSGRFKPKERFTLFPNFCSFLNPSLSFEALSKTIKCTILIKCE